MTSELSTTVASTISEASLLADAWDRLACGIGSPLGTPAWMLGWWTEMAPDSTLQVVAVWDGDQLIGVAPWWLPNRGRRDLRMLGAETANRLDILAVAGTERRVAKALAAVIEQQVRPDLIAFEGISIESDWPNLLFEALGGRRAGSFYATGQRETLLMPLPSDRDPAAWFAGKPKRFRGEMTRMAKRLEGRGGSVRLVREPADRERALEALRLLHDQRQRGAGRDSQFTTPEMFRIFGTIAPDLGPDRFRLWVAELDDKIIASQLYVAAGGNVKFWNHGWDEDYADIQPSKIVIRCAVEDAISRGEREIDFGLGALFYKSRFADVSAPLVWRGIIRRNLRYPRTAMEIKREELRFLAQRSVKALPERYREPAIKTLRRVTS